MIGLHAMPAGDALFAELLAELLDDLSECLDIAEFDGGSLLVDEQEPVPATSDVTQHRSPSGNLNAHLVRHAVT
jgi:hypothetical protein